MHFINVAGMDTDRVDAILEEELTMCGVEVVKNPEVLSHPEVHTHITGKLGNITMYRNWYYWVVDCKVPLDVAKELYADPVGKRDVRVTGHCGCPAPEDPWITYKKDGKMVDYIKNIPAGWEGKSWDSIRDKIMFVENPATEPGVEAFIGSYHIDSEIGLRFFADVIKKHELDREPEKKV